MSSQAFIDVFLMLYRAAMDQPHPTDDLKHAIAVADTAAKGARHSEIRSELEKTIHVPRLARDLCEIYEGE